MQGPRVTALDASNPLPQLEGQLELVVFDGLYGFPDMRTSFEGRKERFYDMLRMMKEMMSLRSPVDEIWLYHPATETVIAGENLNWILSEETLATFPMMMKMMFKANTIMIQDKARKVADPERVAKHWKAILAWKSRTLMGYHERPGEAFFGDGQAALAEAVKRAGQLLG
jgi:hypothetical protein